MVLSHNIMRIKHIQNVLPCNMINFGVTEMFWSLNACTFVKTYRTGHKKRKKMEILPYDNLKWKFKHIICVCLCVCIYTHTYVYTHTHTQPWVKHSVKHSINTNKKHRTDHSSWHILGTSKCPLPMGPLLLRLLLWLLSASQKNMRKKEDTNKGGNW